MSRKISQTKQISAYIDKHGSITHREAEVLCGCTRIAARAYEQGWPCTMIYKDGNKWGKYSK